MWRIRVMSKPKMNMDELKKKAHDISERAGKVSNETEIQKTVEDMAKRYPEQKQTSFGYQAAGSGPLFKSANELLFKSVQGNDELDAFRKWNDDLMIIDAVLSKSDSAYYHKGGIYGTKFYQETKAQHAGMLKHMTKALSSTGTATGDEWVPTGWSSDLYERIRIAQKVSALFPTINMPTNPYRVPAAGADPTAYLTAENTSDSPTASTASTRGTAQREFDAKKLMVRNILSEEIREDSIVPILEIVRNDIVQAFSNAIEDGTVNGDTTNPHMDDDVDTATDHRKAWRGPRKQANSASTEVAAGGTLTADMMTQAQVIMGRFGADISNLVWLVSTQSYGQIKNLTEVQTVDKFGPGASILAGEIGKIYNIPIILSEYVRTNLAADGTYDGTTKNTTEMLLINRRAFWYGNRRELTIKIKDEPEYDQMQMIGSIRKAFRCMEATTATCCAAIINITNFS